MIILCSIHVEENIVLVNLRIVNVSNLSDVPARVRRGETLEGDFEGSGRNKISFVYIERAHPFREEVPVDKFDEPQNRSSVDQTDYAHIRIPTHET